MRKTDNRKSVKTHKKNISSNQEQIGIFWGSLEAIESESERATTLLDFENLKTSRLLYASMYGSTLRTLIETIYDHEPLNQELKNILWGFKALFKGEQRTDQLVEAFAALVGNLPIILRDVFKSVKVGRLIKLVLSFFSIGDQLQSLIIDQTAERLSIKPEFLRLDEGADGRRLVLSSIPVPSPELRALMGSGPVLPEVKDASDSEPDLENQRSRSPLGNSDDQIIRQAIQRWQTSEQGPDDVAAFVKSAVRLEFNQFNYNYWLQLRQNHPSIFAAVADLLANTQICLTSLNSGLNGIYKIDQARYTPTLAFIKRIQNGSDGIKTQQAMIDAVEDMPARIPMQPENADAQTPAPRAFSAREGSSSPKSAVPQQNSKPSQFMWKAFCG